MRKIFVCCFQPSATKRKRQLTTADEFRPTSKWWERWKITRCLLPEGQNWKLKIVISWEEIPSFNCVWLKRTSAHSGFFGTLFRYVSCPAQRVCETHKAESAKNPKNHQEMINLKSLNSIRSLTAHRKKTRTFRHRWFPHALNWTQYNTQQSYRHVYY